MRKASANQKTPNVLYFKFVLIYSTLSQVEILIQPIYKCASNRFTISKAHNALSPQILNSDD